MQVAWPQHELTSGKNAGKKKAAIQWENRCQQAFDDLKRLCTTAPILAYVDFTQPSKLHTDACGSDLGAVLYQTCKDGTDAVIAYASRSLTKAESHYPTHKLEFLALRLVVINKFHEYLYGLAFDVYTDNNPLTYIPYNSQAGSSKSLLGRQLGQLQFPVVLPSQKDQHRCRHLIESVLARMHVWQLR